MNAVGPVRLPAEIDGATEVSSAVVRLVKVVVEPLRVDGDVLQQLAGHLGVAPRRIDRLTAAVADQQLAVDVELVALGVPAEVIVIVEHQNPRLRADALAMEQGRRQPRDAAADDHQIIGLVGQRGRPGPGRSVPGQPVGHLERPGMAAAHAGKRRRIRCPFSTAERQQFPRGKRQACRYAKRNAINEITAGDVELSGHSDPPRCRPVMLPPFGECLKDGRNRAPSGSTGRASGTPGGMFSVDRQHVLFDKPAPQASCGASSPAEAVLRLGLAPDRRRPLTVPDARPALPLSFLERGLW